MSYNMSLTRDELTLLEELYHLGSNKAYYYDYAVYEAVARKLNTATPVNEFRVGQVVVLTEDVAEPVTLAAGAQVTVLRARANTWLRVAEALGSDMYKVRDVNGEVACYAGELLRAYGKVDDE